VRDDVLRIDDLDVVRDLDVGAVTSALRPLLEREDASSRLCSLSTTPFRLSRMSTTSSCTPSMVEYSCSTPAIFTSVGAKPGIEDSSTRRSALPSVWP
jgi:hypothetical protein